MLIRSALVLALSGGGVLAQQDGPDAAPADPAPAALPKCTATVAEGPVDCALDGEGTALSFVYGAAPGATLLVVTQSAPEGGARQISDPIRVDATAFGPQFADKNEDGTVELYLPVNTVGNETLFELWLPDADYFFVRRDEVIAPSVDALVARDGLIVTVTPDADAPEQRIETASILGPYGLTEVYRLRIDTAARTCTLADTGARLNTEVIETDCAQRMGFPPPGASVLPASPFFPAPPSPDISPKAI